MLLLNEFREIVKRDEPLAPHTYFRLGGPAEFFARPRNFEELAAIVSRCRHDSVPLHILGGGCNLLVRDEGVKGVVVKLDHEAFTSIRINGNLVDAGAGAMLSTVITKTAKAELGGLELLVGIPGTIGGSVRMNAGGRAGDIGQFTGQVTIMDWQGNIHVRRRDELQFEYRDTNIDDPVILAGQFELEQDNPEAIIKRMRKIWITKKASQPLGFQSAGCIFKNTRGLAAGLLIEQTGLKGTKVGGAEVSERHANFIIANSSCTARDVLRLIDLVKSRVAERFGVELEMEIRIW
jgi:UDP-N-acetylmuramate dehydrogenase